jgi:hypothetical protein
MPFFVRYAGAETFIADADHTNKRKLDLVTQAHSKTSNEIIAQ